MFAKASRLSKEDIEEVSRAGKSFHTPLFSLKVLINAHLPAGKAGKTAKFAFVASKKECGDSVRRNMAKRRARAAMRHIELKSPIYCIFYLKKAVIKASFQSIVDELQSAFAKQGLV